MGIQLQSDVYNGNPIVDRAILKLITINKNKVAIVVIMIFLANFILQKYQNYNHICFSYRFSHQEPHDPVIRHPGVRAKRLGGGIRWSDRQLHGPLCPWVQARAGHKVGKHIVLVSPCTLLVLSAAFLMKAERHLCADAWQLSWWFEFFFPAVPRKEIAGLLRSSLHHP